MPVLEPTARTSGLITVTTRPNISLWYTSTEDPVGTHKPLIVISNSLGASVALWDQFVQEFSEDYTIIRYDSRFHGRSPLPSDEEIRHVNESTTIEDLAEDAVTLIDKLGIGQGQTIGAFIGLSIGAGVGVILAAKYPSRFNHFVLVGTKIKARDGDGEVFRQRVEFGLQKGSQALAEKSLERWFGGDWIEAQPASAERVRDILSSQDTRGYSASVNALSTMDLSQYVEIIRTRAAGNLTCVVGELDSPEVREDMQLLAKACGSDLAVIPNAGHISHIHQPDAFNAVIRSRLQSAE